MIFRRVWTDLKLHILLPPLPLLPPRPERENRPQEEGADQTREQRQGQGRRLQSALSPSRR